MVTATAVLAVILGPIQREKSDMSAEIIIAMNIDHDKYRAYLILLPYAAW